MLGYINVGTRSRTEFVDISREIEKLVEESQCREGICCIYVPHTTAGITINENADPDVARDMLMELDKIVPLKDNYRHAEGNSAAHIKASMMGFSLHIIIQNGKLLLGTWQGVYFCEFDGPRSRKVAVKIIRG
ncbi:MAG: secondary thiamine-phosphate synthase enzyme YjbQ [Bacillota bacterium]